MTSTDAGSVGRVFLSKFKRLSNEFFKCFLRFAIRSPCIFESTLEIGGSLASGLFAGLVLLTQRCQIDLRRLRFFGMNSILGGRLIKSPQPFDELGDLLGAAANNH